MKRTKLFQRQAGMFLETLRAMILLELDLTLFQQHRP